MSRLIVESADGSVPPAFTTDTGPLVTFLSFAAAERYGSIHPLSAAAKLLRSQHRINLGPLFDFTDAEIEDDEDRRALERLWQAPAPLAESSAAVAAMLRSDASLAKLTGELPTLPALLDELAAVARWAAAQDVRLRLTYRLD